MNSNTIYAARSDGLGERLNSIFNAIALSKLTGIEYKVCWPDSYVLKSEYHSVENIDCIFSANFIKKNVLSSAELTGAQSLKIPKMTLAQLPKYIKNSILKGKVLVPQNLVLDQIDFGSVKRKILLANINLEFDFSDRIKVVRDIVMNIDIPVDSSAIHLRSGDIIYGKHNEVPRFHVKLVCAPVAAELIKLNKLSGKNTILFGQEKHSISKFSERFNVLSSNDYLDEFNFNRLELAFADIFLMSRCVEIFSGSSGFSRFAAQIGDIPLRSLSQIKNMTDWSKVISREVFEFPYCYTGEVKAYSLFIVYMHARDTGSFEFLDELLQRSILFNKKNMMYQLYLALNNYKFNKTQTADSIFANLLLSIEGCSSDAIAKSRIVKLLETETSHKSGKSFFSYYKVFLLSEANCVSIYSQLILFFCEDDLNIKSAILRNKIIPHAYLSKELTNYLRLKVGV